MGDPHWAMRKDAWGKPIGRYSFCGIKGWLCHHCGGMFRGLTSLLEHQARAQSEDASRTRGE